MPPPLETVKHAAEQASLLGGLKTGLVVFAVWAAMGVSRYLNDHDKSFNWKQFVSEILLAFVGSIVIASLGLWQEWPMYKTLFVGSFASLGGIEFVKQVARLLRAIKI